MIIIAYGFDTFFIIYWKSALIEDQNLHKMILAWVPCWFNDSLECKTFAFFLFGHRRGISHPKIIFYLLNHSRIWKYKFCKKLTNCFCWHPIFIIRNSYYLRIQNDSMWINEKFNARMSITQLIAIIENICLCHQKEWLCYDWMFTTQSFAQTIC